MTMSFVPPALTSDIDWEVRPTGGALALRAPYPTDADVTLELVFAHGRPFWFMHVLGVPFEIDAGVA